MSEIRIKRVYDAPAGDDGYRVLVDRLWPRGISKERAVLDDWWKDIAPSPELRKWFGHEPERFAEFAEKYRAELSTGTAAPARSEGSQVQSGVCSARLDGSQHDESVIAAPGYRGSSLRRRGV